VFKVPFINREEELKVLREYAERGFYPILLIYGPEGCGKTRLLKEFIKSIEETSDYIIVYVDAQNVGSLKDAVYAPPLLLEAFSSLVESISEPVGKFSARMLPYVFKKFFEKRLRNKHVIIAVDDVARPLGVDVIESYVKTMLNLLEWIVDKGAESAFIVATTSEGLSLSLLARHSYVSLSEVWNLSREAAEELLSTLGAPKHLFEEIWLMSGGNPRAILAISARNWNLDIWFREVARNIVLATRSIVFKYRSQLAEVVENVDSLVNWTELEEALIKANLVTPISRPCLGYTPPIDLELGVGKYYAWQIPAYRKALEKILKL